jgi:anti-anti-sigma factor
MKDFSMLTITTDNRGSVIVIRLNGNMTNETINKMLTLWNSQIRMSPSIIGFDCDMLTGIDSTAIGTIVKFFNEAREKNIRLIFFDLDNSIQHLFETAHLDRFIRITDRAGFEMECPVAKNG